ncbi:MAG: hypothetical protein ACRDK3_02915 [Actinomycetota bacterium]
MTPLVSKIHLCIVCNVVTVWCRSNDNPTRAFCCKCGAVEEVAAEALLD